MTDGSNISIQIPDSAAACLSRMRDLIARMGGLAESQMAAAQTALLTRDGAGAQNVIQGDDDIDDIQAQIEQLMLAASADAAAGQPEWVEGLSLIKIAAELERVGDFTKNIAKRTLVINSFPAQQVVQGLGRMMHEVRNQLSAVLDAASAEDEALARKVWEQDGSIDELNNALFQEITSLMMAEPDTIKVATHFLFIAKNLERVGDHCTNVAELVFALKTGKPLTDDRPKADRTSLTLVNPHGQTDAEGTV